MSGVRGADRDPGAGVPPPEHLPRLPAAAFELETFTEKEEEEEEEDAEEE